MLRVLLLFLEPLRLARAWKRVNADVDVLLVETDKLATSIVVERVGRALHESSGTPGLGEALVTEADLAQIREDGDTAEDRLVVNLMTDAGDPTVELDKLDYAEEELRSNVHEGREMFQLPDTSGRKGVAAAFAALEHALEDTADDRSAQAVAAKLDSLDHRGVHRAPAAATAAVSLHADDEGNTSTAKDSLRADVTAMRDERQKLEKKAGHARQGEVRGMGRVGQKDGGKSVGKANSNTKSASSIYAASATQLLAQYSTLPDADGILAPHLIESSTAGARMRSVELPFDATEVKVENIAGTRQLLVVAAREGAGGADHRAAVGEVSQMKAGKTKPKHETLPITNFELVGVLQNDAPGKATAFSVAEHVRSLFGRGESAAQADVSAASQHAQKEQGMRKGKGTDSAGKESRAASKAADVAKNKSSTAKANLSSAQTQHVHGQTSQKKSSFAAVVPEKALSSIMDSYLGEASTSTGNEGQNKDAAGTASKNTIEWKIPSDEAHDEAMFPRTKLEKDAAEWLVGDEGPRLEKAEQHDQHKNRWASLKEKFASTKQQMAAQHASTSSTHQQGAVPEASVVHASNGKMKGQKRSPANEDKLAQFLRRDVREARKAELAGAVRAATLSPVPSEAETAREAAKTRVDIEKKFLGGRSEFSAATDSTTMTAAGPAVSDAEAEAPADKALAAYEANRQKTKAEKERVAAKGRLEEAAAEKAEAAFATGENHVETPEVAASTSSLPQSLRKGVEGAHRVQAIYDAATGKFDAREATPAKLDASGRKNLDDLFARAAEKSKQGGASATAALHTPASAAVAGTVLAPGAATASRVASGPTVSSSSPGAADAVPAAAAANKESRTGARRSENLVDAATKEEQHDAAPGETAKLDSAFDELDALLHPVETVVKKVESDEKKVQTAAAVEKEVMKKPATAGASRETAPAGRGSVVVVEKEQAKEAAATGGNQKAIEKAPISRAGAAVAKEKDAATTVVAKLENAAVASRPPASKKENPVGKKAAAAPAKQSVKTERKPDAENKQRATPQKKQVSKVSAGKTVANKKERRESVPSSAIETKKKEKDIAVVATPQASAPTIAASRSRPVRVAPQEPAKPKPQHGEEKPAQVLPMTGKTQKQTGAAAEASAALREPTQKPMSDEQSRDFWTAELKSETGTGRERSTNLAAVRPSNEKKNPPKQAALHSDERVSSPALVTQKSAELQVTATAAPKIDLRADMKLLDGLAPKHPSAAHHHSLAASSAAPRNVLAHTVLKAKPRGAHEEMDALSTGMRQIQEDGEKILDDTPATTASSASADLARYLGEGSSSSPGNSNDGTGNRKSIKPKANKEVLLQQGSGSGAGTEAATANKEAAAWFDNLDTDHLYDRKNVKQELNWEKKAVRGETSADGSRKAELPSRSGAGGGGSESLAEVPTKSNLSWGNLSAKWASSAATVGKQERAAEKESGNRYLQLLD
eukprot:g15025.t1